MPVYNKFLLDISMWKYRGITKLIIKGFMSEESIRINKVLKELNISLEELWII
jgi:hypothetical protein